MECTNIGKCRNYKAPKNTCIAWKGEDCFKSNAISNSDAENSDSPHLLSGIERALKTREELFDIANSYAGNEKGPAALWLHEACNCILRADKCLEEENT